MSKKTSPEVSLWRRRLAVPVLATTYILSIASCSTDTDTDKNTHGCTAEYVDSDYTSSGELSYFNNTASEVIERITNSTDGVEAFSEAEGYLRNRGVMLDVGPYADELNNASSVTLDKWKLRLASLIEGYTYVPKDISGINKVGFTDQVIEASSGNAYDAGRRRGSKRTQYVVFDPSNGTLTFDPTALSTGFPQRIGSGFNVEAYVTQTCGTGIGELLQLPEYHTGVSTAVQLYGGNNWEQTEYTDQLSRLLAEIRS